MYTLTYCLFTEKEKSRMASGSYKSI